MSANIFKIEGSPRKVDSREEFMSFEETLEVEGKMRHKFSDMLFYPDCFNENPAKTITIKDGIITNVSFKDTEFNNVRFLDCEFNQCIFLSSKFFNCEFINCSFIKTNTNKSKFAETLIDPKDFSNNFDLKNDTNIAADLYHSLYKNLTNERQPDRAIDSLYMMYRAENAHLSSQLKRKKITKLFFIKKKSWHLFSYLTSGYGLKLHRVLITLSIVVGLSSLINYIYRDDFFSSGDVTTPIDAFYFTLVTLTTLGYGDISPCTQLGRLVVSCETAIGIVVISLFLSSISSKTVRA
jgi:hypothetical protein